MENRHQVYETIGLGCSSSRAAMGRIGWPETWLGLWQAPFPVREPLPNSWRIPIAQCVSGGITGRNYMSCPHPVLNVNLI